MLRCVAHTFQNARMHWNMHDIEQLYAAYRSKWGEEINTTNY